MAETLLWFCKWWHYERVCYFPCVFLFYLFVCLYLYHPFLWHVLCSARNYNPVERRTKGGKERNPKGYQKNSKSLQSNNMHNPGYGDTGIKIAGQHPPKLFWCMCPLCLHLLRLPETTNFNSLQQGRLMQQQVGLILPVRFRHYPKRYWYAVPAFFLPKREILVSIQNVERVSLLILVMLVMVAWGICLALQLEIL